MADLDDFFAKKDKRKGKKTQKFTTAEETVKKLEDPKKPDRPTRKDKSGQDGENGLGTREDQDEWKEFQEEEEKKDYTGLKIGNLTIDPDANMNSGADGDSNGEDENGSGADGSSNADSKGPWRRMEQSGEKAGAKSTTTADTVTKSETPTEPKRYLAPSMRNQQRMEAARSSAARSKVAPDINSTEYFPSLSGGPAKPRNDPSFEEVRPGKASSRADQRANLDQQAPKLTLGNRFNTLSNTNDS